jgi:ParB family chromosome partitioning protein
MRSALGKGLDALISEDTAASVSAPAVNGSPRQLPILQLQPNPAQPRHHFDDAALQELTASIQARGVLQPILVTPLSDGKYEIVAGERRWRAAQRAGLRDVPVTVQNIDERERFALALIENIQREDLNPIEQAEGYRKLQNDFGWTQEKIAETVGKDRAVVANLMRLLNLPDEIRAALVEGTISAGHGRALAALDDATAQNELFRRIVAENLPVRQIEEAVRAHKKVRVRAHLRSDVSPSENSEARAIEEELQRVLTRKIELHVSNKTSQKGWIRLEFYSLDDLDALIAQLKKAGQP